MLEICCLKMIMLEEDEEAISICNKLHYIGKDNVTSSALTWLFYILTCHPEIEDEVVKELKSLENQKLLEFETLKQLRYLMACLCECLRLYPPVAWDSKHALVDDFLPDGGKICAGDRVTYFQYGMGRMVNLWGEDRFEFRPERWIIHLDLEEEGDEHIVGPLKKILLISFQFVAGPRTCLEKEMAFVQMKYIVAMLLKKFKFRPVDSENSPKFVPLLTAHMHGGFWAFVERRDQFQ
ncbi:hypothetical protein Leryth_013374 [Lithospermum erythrorhizon]|nr:hypothetical protein Leryth_013374 [Lithospermum erythrorhizon]